MEATSHRKKNDEISAFFGAPHVTPMAAMQLGSQEGDLLLNIMGQGLTMAGGGHGRAKMAWMLNGQLMAMNAMNGYSRFIVCK